MLIMRHPLPNRTLFLLTFLLSAVLTVVAPASAQQFDRNWEFSENVNSDMTPSYLSGARALAYGMVDDGSGNTVERVFVSHNADDPFEIEILDPATGEDIGNLNTSGVADVSRDIQDVEVTSGGVIIACNEVNNPYASSSDEDFRCYRWDSLTDSPTEILSYTPEDQNGDDQADAVGRLIDIAGSFDGALTILTAASALQGGTPDNVYRFTTTDGGSNFSTEVVDRTGDETTDGLNAVGQFESGSAPFIYNPAANNPRSYSADGAFQSTAPDEAVSNFTHALRLFNVGSREFMVTFNWEGGGAGQYATVVEITDGLGSAFPYGSTPSLGSGDDNPNGTGDVDYRINDDGTVTNYVLATDTGIGSYTTTQALPVELAHFEAAQQGSGVELTWQTASETRNEGFRVQRAVDGGTFAPVGDFVDGAGTTSETQRYHFTDERVPHGAQTLAYRLEQVDADGRTTLSEAVEVQLAAPDAFALQGNAPNPVRDRTTIRYELPQAAHVRITVYDVRGRTVATPVDAQQASGYQRAHFDASRLSSGVYLYRIEAGDRTRTGRMTVVK